LSVVALSLTLYTDPGCPWAYSAIPAQTVLRWRYGSQLQWRLVTIGLAEDPKRYIDAGYTPTRSAVGQLYYRKTYGMPFALVPRERITATSRACRALVATRLLQPGREFDALRALQLAWFTTPLLLDQDADIAAALQNIPGLDAAEILAAIDDPRIIEAYEEDKRQTRQAEGGPTHFQGKARQTDGPVRYSAPSIIFEHDGRRLEAGGFQSIDAYDVLVANLDPTLERQAPPEGPLAALQSFAHGLTTQEVAAIMAHNNQAPDRQASEAALIELVGAGEARRTALGDDAIWQAA
jgi:protein-disulfide isomerase-like protein with CxxC motif